MGDHGSRLRGGEQDQNSVLPTVEGDIREILQAVRRLESNIAENNKKVDELTKTVGTVKGKLFSLAANTGTDTGETMINIVTRILRKVEKL